ncbi:type VI secretion system contractile sheath large subunit [bacterium]|nr:type VI secretion system contractile sheath large subunit [bacterium]
MSTDSTAPLTAQGTANSSVVIREQSPELDKLVRDTLENVATQVRGNSEEKIYVTGLMEQVLNGIMEGQIRISDDLITSIDEEIARLDRLMSDQLAEIMHHDEFQKLEASWSGLHHMVQTAETGTMLKIKVLNASKRELSDDLKRAKDFDQSQFFLKIYGDEYDKLGGDPYSVIIGDYQFDVKNSQEVDFLQKIASVASAAHAPFIAAASPSSFGLESFSELNEIYDLASVFDHRRNPFYTRWNSFRESVDSRYVALTVPGYLGRLPYGKGDCEAIIPEFAFDEKVDGTTHEDYLWVNSAYLLGEKVAEAFVDTGWYAAIAGVENGGLAENLPVHVVKTAEGDAATKCPIEVSIGERRENELAQLGFVPVVHYKNTDRAVFMSVQSCQKPKVYASNEATASAELTANLSYLLIVSRIAHYIHAICRDKIMAYKSKEDMQKLLHNWLHMYVVEDPGGEEQKRKYPLKSAQVEVEEDPARPGCYRAVAHIVPHIVLKEISVSLRLVANLPDKG